MPDFLLPPCAKFGGLTAEVQFTVKNSSSLASATHPPVIGYMDFWNDNISPAVNQLVVGDGPMHTTTQTFSWSEIIDFIP